MPETEKAPAALLASIECLPSLGEGLRAAGFRPSKALGQHFLLDLNAKLLGLPCQEQQ